MHGGAMHGVREAEVLARLDRVTDPELDESVTELGFITGVEVSPDGGVSVAFRLPTYWCAANFAFMMADDMRREVAALPWVTGVVPRLGEHMYADQINRGVAAGLSFQDSFGDAAAGDLGELRHAFLVKAFQRRQEALLRHLLAAGQTAEALVAATMADLALLALDPAGERLRDRYAERRGIAGPASGGALAPGGALAFPGGALAFVDAEGGALPADGLPAHLRSLRRIGTNAEFNGALCSGLLAARFGADQPAADGEPTLLDFARMGPARRQAVPAP